MIVFEHRLKINLKIDSEKINKKNKHEILLLAGFK